jgi:hypothetical protein
MSVLEQFTADEMAQMFSFLDGLRASGAINMFGAYPVLAKTYGLEQDLARGVAALWMQSFNSRLPAPERVSQLFAAENGEVM